MKKPQFEMSHDTRILADLLRKVPIGEAASYSDLSAAIARNVQEDARYVMQSALRSLEREGIIFGAIRGVGVKRLNDAEMVSAADDAIPRIRRLSKRAMRKLASVSSFDALPNEVRVRHNAAMSLLGTISHFATETAHKKVEAIIKDKPEPLSITKTLEAFKK